MTTLLQGIKQWAQYASQARACQDTIGYADAVERLGKLVRYYRLIEGKNRKQTDVLILSWTFKNSMEDGGPTALFTQPGSRQEGEDYGPNSARSAC